MTACLALAHSPPVDSSYKIVQNCTKFSGDGAVIIQSNSKVTFENAALSGNQRSAILVNSNANLTLRGCYFENNGVQNTTDVQSTNGAQKTSGGAIRVMDNVLLLINSSSFHGTNSCHIK